VFVLSLWSQRRSSFCRSPMRGGNWSGILASASVRCGREWPCILHPMIERKKTQKVLTQMMSNTAPSPYRRRWSRAISSSLLLLHYSTPSLPLQTPLPLHFHKSTASSSTKLTSFSTRRSAPRRYPSTNLSPPLSSIPPCGPPQSAPASRNSS
jgi:hypothetical protein